MRNSIITSFILILFCYVTATGQVYFSIKGNVLNGEDSKPLVGVNVFLANTSHGTVSGPNGEFELSKLPSGRYKLIASSVGYEPLTTEIMTSTQKVYTLILKPAVLQLDEVVIMAKKRGASKWASNYKMFKEHFIGISDNANACVIENPRTLTFTLEAEKLEARADSLLIVTNNGPGYRMSVLVEKYNFNLVTRIAIFRGQVLYEQLVPKNEKEKLEWAENRLKAYYGSQMHFMRALYDRRLIDEGFFTNVFKDVFVDSVWQRKAIADTELKVKSKLYKANIKIKTITNYKRLLDTVRTTPNHPVLGYDGELEIVYVNEAESHQFHRHRDPGGMGFIRPQRSLLIMNGNDVSIESNGSIMSEEKLATKGYWSWELFSEGLPIDYMPDEDERLVHDKKYVEP